MRYYDELIRLEDRGGFEIIVDKTWEDIDVGQCFDESCYDIQELRDKINSYHLDWFMLRARALINGLELGSAYLGGCLYEDAREVLSDGTAEDLIEQAVIEARQAVGSLRERLDKILV
jgi:hypothetical protein